MIPANYSGTWTVWCADSEDPEPLARGVSRAEAFALVTTTDRENVYAAPDLAVDEEPEPEATEVYRVWARGLDSVWFPVSRAFKNENDAQGWALALNLEHRVEAEDAP